MIVARYRAGQVKVLLMEDLASRRFTVGKLGKMSFYMCVTMGAGKTLGNPPLALIACDPSEPTPVFCNENMMNKVESKTHCPLAFEMPSWK
jgi:hypothetical protein